MTSRRLMFEWALLLALAIGGASWLHTSGLTSRIDNQILDRVSALTSPPVSDEIVLVTIDDASLEEVGQWPWPRATHARMVDRLRDAGARLVVLDVLFQEPSNEEDDAALAEAIAASGNVILPHSFVPRINAEYGLDPAYPIDDLRDAAKGLGHVFAAPDQDGVLRRFDLDYDIDGEGYPHMAVQIMEALGEPVGEETAQADPVVPFQPIGAFTEAHAHDVLSGATDDGFLRDKIVLVGATAPGLGDRYSVASGEVGLMSGVETQANLVNGLLYDAMIHPIGQTWHNLAAAGALLILFLAFWYLSPRYVLVCAVAVVVAALCLSIGALAIGRAWFAPSSIILMVMLAYPLWSWRRLSHASRYLEREAARLTGGDVETAEQSGFDYFTRQIMQLRAIIRTVHTSLSFLRRIIEAAPDAIIVLDEGEKVQMMNAKAAQLFPDGEALDETTFGEFLLHSRAKLVRGGAELETADGRTFLVARADLSETEKLGTAGSIVALREVTELRRLDNERRQMLEFLSHDMRTPQVAIVGLTRNPSSFAEGARDTVKRIRQQAERTLKLADDFVQLARLESPRLQREDCDVGALVEEACDRAFVPAQAKRITLEQSLPEEPVFALVEPSLLARLLDNLIGNAIKYSGEDGDVTVSLEQHGEESFSLTVADRGPGLSPERVKDPFARFGAHTKGAGPSAGLGLALVKKVVDAHRGEITVHSETDKGTRFEVTLPLVTKPA